MVTKNRERSLAHTLEYSLRVSNRARNVTLKVNRAQGLMVVVPENFDQVHLPDILASREPWIKKQLEKFQALPGKFESDWPPSSLELPGAGVRFDVNYINVPGERIRLRQRDCQLEVGLPERFNNDNLVALFVRWLKSLAKTHCESVATELSESTGLDYQKLTVRAQKTRWGSYSTRGTLSLNYKLLFLPQHLMRHVILHELSHSVHMNHSSDFWDLLEKVDPGSKQHDDQLNSAWRYIPAWLD